MAFVYKKHLTHRYLVVNIRMKIENNDIEVIKLKDGTIFEIKELLNKKTQRTNINLRTGRVSKNPKARLKEPKYSIAERIWQMTASLDELQQRYNITEKQAYGMRYTAKYAIENLERAGIISYDGNEIRISPA